MKKISPHKLLLSALVLAVLVFLIFVPPNFPPYWMGITTMVLLWAAMASAFNIMGGYTGQVCFISALFSGLGSYFTMVLLLNFNISPWIGMFISAAATTVVAVGLGMVFFRYGLRDVYFALGTMAALTVMITVFLSLPGFGGALGLNIIITEDDFGMMMFRSKLPYYYIMLGIFVVVVAFCAWLSKSKLGYYFQSIRENSEAAESLGVNVFSYKVLAMSLTAFILAICGSFWGMYVTYIDPYTQFSSENAGLIIIMMIAGGAGTVVGPLIGATVLYPFTEIIRAKLGQMYPGSHLVLYGIVLMGIVLYMPDGFISILTKWNKKILHSIATGNLSPKVKHIVKELFDPEPEILREMLAQPVVVSNEVPPVRVFERDAAKTEEDYILVASNLCRNFGGLAAVSDVSLKVRRGEIYGIIGPNGAGKTTTFNLLSGVLRPTSGTVELNGENITGLFPHVVCEKHMARTFQITQAFPKLTVLETVMIGALLRHPNPKDAERKAYEVLRDVGMLDKATYSTENITLADLKRLEVAKALASDPEVILLDEVVAGLTEVEVDQVVTLLKKVNREFGVTIIMIEHVMRAIMALCDRITVLNFGEKIAEGTPQEITSDPFVIEAYLGKEMEVSNA